MPPDPDLPPILAHKEYSAPSVFTPQNLLREARRQKSLPPGPIPRVCLLDPDGDLVAYLKATRRAQLNPYWACYHTHLYTFQHESIEFGIVGAAVGASFAVLVAEEMFASGCELLISITSAGQIVPIAQPPYFFVIEKALRDEGASHHYLPPARYSEIDPRLNAVLKTVFQPFSSTVFFGASWTTDAPFRETKAAIAAARAEGILGVEMEAAALYAFARARAKPVICLAQITNQMGSVENDFEKGEANHALLTLFALMVRGLRG